MYARFSKMSALAWPFVSKMEWVTSILAASAS